MARKSDAEYSPENEGPDPAGAYVPPRNPEDGTPAVPKADPRREAHMTEAAADALDTELESGEEIPQP